MEYIKEVEGVFVAGSYSLATVAPDGHVELAGLMAFDGEGNIRGDTVKAQTEHIMDAAGRILGAAGCSFADVTSAQVLLNNPTLADFREFDAAYKTHFSDGNFPARAVYGANLLMGAEVEIVFRAHRDAHRQ